MSRILLASAVVLAVLFALVPADATTTPTPFLIESCAASTTGHTIGAAGNYKLSDSVFNCHSSPMISIEASNVTVDLGGMLLDGDPTAGQCTVAIRVPFPETNVTVKNGTISGCNGIGISMVSATHSKISGMVIRAMGSTGSGTAATLGSNGTFTGNTIVNNLNYGLSAGDSSTISKNSFLGNVGWAILAGKQNQIVGNKISKTGDDAMFITGDSNTFKSNIISGNAGDGICTLGKSNVITGNTIIGNDEIGIEASGDGNHITNNNTKANGDEGIRAGESGSVISGNKSIGNVGAGIDIDDPTRTTITKVTISKNKTNANGDAGINLSDPLDGVTTTTITKNTANGNVGKGIYIAGGQPAGKRTNIGTGNVTKPDCDAFLCP